jgi:hypothetical protein
VQEVNFISKLIYYLQLNIAAENGLFMDDLPIYIYIEDGDLLVLLNYQRVLRDGTVLS